MKNSGEDISRLRILNDIYKNENEYLKKEYRNLFEQYMLEKKKNENKNITNIVKRGLKKIKRGWNKHE